jgi:hypothetical protein
MSSIFYNSHITDVLPSPRQTVLLRYVPFIHHLCARYYILVMLRTYTENYIIFNLVVFVVFLLSVLGAHQSHKRNVFKNNAYRYIAKPPMITRTEPFIHR